MASESGEIQCFPPEQRYMDILEQTASFNTRLAIERKMRLPFLDSQTGVAQRHTNLFYPYRHRQPGTVAGQLYSYPAKRWKKKKRSFIFSERRVVVNGDIETGEADMHQISAVENPAHRLEEHEFDHLEAGDGWYDDVDDFGEPPDDGAMVDDQSDISDFEDSLKGRKRKKNTNKGRKKKNEDHSKELLSPEDKEKPYACEACGARYKTRPGLAYHYSHFHNGMIEEESRTPSPKLPTRANSGPVLITPPQCCHALPCTFFLLAFSGLANLYFTRMLSELIFCLYSTFFFLLITWLQSLITAYALPVLILTNFICFA